MKKILPAKFKTKKSKSFWNEVPSNLRDTVEIFDEKYIKVLIDDECQSSSVANDTKSCLEESSTMFIADIVNLLSLALEICYINL